MGDRRPVAGILTSTTDPTYFRAACKRCSWASHPGGTDHDGAVLAAVAHVESAHAALDVIVEAVQ